MVAFCNDASLQLTTELTLEAVFLRDTTHGENVGIASKYIGAGNQRGYSMYMNTAEQLGFVLSRDGDTTPLTTLECTTITDVDTWYYAAGRYKASDTTAELRLNDAEEAATGAAITSIKNSSAEFAIGVQYSFISSFAWGGQIDEVRLSKIKRTDDWCDATYYGLFDNLITLVAGVAEGVAPTATLYGPMVGPLGGPI